MFLSDSGFIWLRVDAEQNRAFFNQLVRHDFDTRDDSADCRDDWRRNKKFPRHVGVGMVVVHQQDQSADENRPTQRGGRNRPFVERDFEDFEDDNTDGRICKEE